MLSILCICIALTSAFDFTDEYKTYNGYIVVEVIPSTRDQVTGLHDLSHDIEIDFWTEWKKPNQPIRFMLPPNEVRRTIDYIEDHDMNFRIINHDVGVQVTNEVSRLRSRANGNMAFDINDFNTYDDIMTELDAMAARCPAPLTCVVDTLGLSYQGRPIKVLRISAGGATTGYWIDSIIHAREWLGSATVLKIMDHFTRDYGRDVNVTSLVDGYDWHFAPILNPDGYEYTWTNDRYWRKSRNVNDGSSCNGTDLNTNFNSHWSSDGTSADPCSHTYHGAGPTSEPETQAIQSELDRLAPTLTGVVSVHTAGCLWVFSWGYTEGGECARTADYDDRQQIAIAAANATQNTYGTQDWIPGTICEVIYPISGTICDYSTEAGIAYSFTPELRRDDAVVPSSEIEPSFQELYNGIKAMVAEIESITTP